MYKFSSSTKLWETRRALLVRDNGVQSDSIYSDSSSTQLDALCTFEVAEDVGKHGKAEGAAG